MRKFGPPLRLIEISASLWDETWLQNSILFAFFRFCVFQVGFMFCIGQSIAVGMYVIGAVEICVVCIWHCFCVLLSIWQRHPRSFCMNFWAHISPWEIYKLWLGSFSVHLRFYLLVFLIDWGCFLFFFADVHDTAIDDCGQAKLLPDIRDMCDVNSWHYCIDRHATRQ